MRINLRSKILLSISIITLVSIFLYTLSLFSLRNRGQDLSKEYTDAKTFYSLRIFLDSWLLQPENKLALENQDQTVLDELTSIINESEIFDFMIFGPSLQAKLQGGQLRLPTSGVDIEDIDKQEYWKKLLEKIGYSTYFFQLPQDLELDDRMFERIYIPFGIQSEKPQWVFMAHIYDDFYRAMSIPFDENFWLRWILGIFLILILNSTAFIILYPAFIKPINNINETVLGFLEGDLGGRIRYFAEDELGFLSTNLNEIIDTHERLVERNEGMSVEMAALESQINNTNQIIGFLHNHNIHPKTVTTVDGINWLVREQHTGIYRSNQFDFIRLSEDKQAFYLVETEMLNRDGALLSLSAATYIKDKLEAGLTPSEVLKQLNNDLYTMLNSKNPLHCAIFIKDLQSSEVKYATAGLIVCALWRPDGSVDLLSGKSKVISPETDNNFAFPQATVSILEKDILLLSSAKSIGVSLIDGSQNGQWQDHFVKITQKLSHSDDIVASADNLMNQIASLRPDKEDGEQESILVFVQKAAQQEPKVLPVVIESSKDHTNEGKMLHDSRLPIAESQTKDQGRKDQDESQAEMLPEIDSEDFELDIDSDDEPVLTTATDVQKDQGQSETWADLDIDLEDDDNFLRSTIEEIERELEQDLEQDIKQMEEEPNAQEASTEIGLEVEDNADDEAENEDDHDDVLSLENEMQIAEDSYGESSVAMVEEYGDQQLKSVDELKNVDTDNQTKINENQLSSAKDLYNQKDFSAAAKIFRELVKLNPENLEALLFYSDSLLHLEQNDQALEGYQKLIKKSPDDPDLHFKVGLLNYRLGNLRDSTQAMEKAIEMKTSYGDAWLYAGVSYANQGEYKQALSLLEKAKAEGIYLEEVETLIGQIQSMKKTA